VSRQLIGPPVEGATEVEVDGRVSAFSPLTRQIVVLNDTASDIWRLADGEHDLEAIVALLAAAYSVAPEDIEADVRHAVDELVDAGLLPAAPEG
jgi:uncharacterized membrane protein YkvA (DUF1232 family)